MAQCIKVTYKLSRLLLLHTLGIVVCLDVLFTKAIISIVIFIKMLRLVGHRNGLRRLSSTTLFKSNEERSVDIDKTSYVRLFGYKGNVVIISHLTARFHQE